MEASVSTKVAVEALLQTYARFGVDLGLARIERLLRDLGNPHESGAHRSRGRHEWKRLSLRISGLSADGSRLSNRAIYVAPFGELDRAYLY